MSVNRDSEIKLLKFLEKENIISSKNIKEIIINSIKEKISYIDFAIKSNLLNEDHIIELLSEKLGFIKADLKNKTINKNLLKIVPLEFALENNIIPLELEHNTLSIAMFNPFQLETIMELENKTGYMIKNVLSSKTEIKKQIYEFYGMDPNKKNFIREESFKDTELYQEDLKLLNFLEHSNLINKVKIKEVINYGKLLNISPLSVAIENKFIDEEDVINLLSMRLNISKASITEKSISPEILSLISPEFALDNICLPLELNENKLSIAIFNPFQISTFNRIEKINTLVTIPKLMARTTLIEYIKKYYLEIDNNLSADNEIISELSKIDFFPEGSLDINQSSKYNNRYNLSEISSNDAPIVKLVNFIIHNAIKNKASDIHIEQLPDFVLIRYRIDGILHEMQKLPKTLENGINSRIKILSKMDIAEKRIPQDGNMKIRSEDRDIDIRVSTIPAHYGEKIVLRLLQSSNIIYIDNLGLPPEELEILKINIHKPQGIILVTGPTGSGKSSTLYACINEINKSDINIVTAEDPIEFNISGVNQVQINNKIGVTFANILRSFLRQDPNVIMIGEIRDKETAEIAFNAAMTGHLVLTTLHTNSSISAITRLLDLGIPPFLISSSLLMVLAQRLVRKNCTNCLTEYTPDMVMIKRLGLENKKITYRKGTGCNVCKGTGLKGRIGIYEVFTLNENIKSLIHEKSSEDKITELSKMNGMQFLFDDAIQKLNEGLVTLEEINRVIPVSVENTIICPSCKFPIKADFNLCPYCFTKLHSQCPICRRIVEPKWLICPYCNINLDK